MAIKVTVTDTETGESEDQEIENNYVLISAGTCYVSDTQAYPTKGTHALTVKGIGSK